MKESNMVYTVYEAALTLAEDRYYYVNEPDMTVEDYLEEILEENFSEM